MFSPAFFLSKIRSFLFTVFNYFFKYFFDFTLKCLRKFDDVVELLVPGGKHYLQREPCCFPKTPTRDDPNDLKRIKLLLDISVTPGPSGVSVNSKVTKVSTTATIWHKIFVFPASCLLNCTCFIRKILLRLQYKVNDDGTLGNCDYTDRKIISPRKRIKRSAALVDRILPNCFPFSILKGSHKLTPVDFPMVDLPDASSELKSSRLKSAEKRKRSSSDNEDDTPSASNPSSSASSAVKGSQNPTSEYDSSDAHVNGNMKVKDTSGHSTCVRSLSKDIFEVDEDYKSADDPDYSPSEGELEQSSSSVNSNNSSIYEDDVSLEEKTNENGLSASSPATSTTDIHEGDTTNRQDPVWLDEGLLLPRSPCPRNEQDSFYGSPGSASGFDSPHSTTSCNDDDGVTSS